ncbi:MAG: spermidine/putrescine import ATP-binding protein PotA [uncultured bacterium]|nr:MAG: spermidine/putrescine import ATP-binding protein PotA [uncultured bacterium]
MLTITQLSLTLNHQTILQDVSLQIGSGSITSLVGPSGAGKSSLLRCIAGLETYTGTISLNQKPLDAVPTAQRGLGYVEQDNTLFPHLSVEKNIAYPLRVRRQPITKINRAVSDIMLQLHLAKLAKRYPHQLSGGEQRRVMLARTLIYQPTIVLFDEPFAGVDALLRVELVHLLKTLMAQRRIPLIYVTHDLAEAEFLSNSVIVLRDGKVETHQTWPEIKKVTNPWLQTFLNQRF